MKIQDVNWQEDNNVRFVLDGNPELAIDLTIETNTGVEDLKEVLGSGKYEFIHFNGISINLNKVRYVIYKNRK